MSAVDAIERSWRDVFGLGDEPLWGAGIAVTAHGTAGTLRNYSGIWVVNKGDACRVSAPSHLTSLAQSIVDESSPEDIDTGRAFETLFAPSPIVLGPSLHAYATLDTLIGTAVGNAVIREVDNHDLISLREACAIEEWKEGGFESSPLRLFALLENDELVAAANLTHWRSEFDDVGLIVHPKHRGQGFGAAIASYAALEAVKEYGVVRYRSRHDNHASVAIQRRLGFEVYCRQAAIRIGETL